MTTGEGTRTRVFVSYAHDSSQHRRLVLRLCTVLARQGVDVHVDEWHTDLRRDWFLWMIEQLERADHVIAVASPQYRAAGDGNVPADIHRGVQTESAVLRNHLYRDRETWTRKLLPVILPGRSVDEIPLYLQPHCASHYRVHKLSATGVQELARVLTRRSDPPVLAPAPAPTRHRPTAAVMSTLPRGVASFTGRRQEAEQLIARVTEQDAGIHVVTGMPGVGKTEFAVHVARRVADRFPDGHLFLELRGHTPGQGPLAPADALRSLLVAIGVPTRLIPPTLDDRARMWRDRLAGKRMLLVLDDAADHEQVRPLLPGTPGCQVVITSRRRVPALEDARPLPLTVLPPDAAVAMFVRLSHRPADDQASQRIRELVRVCGHLPLAIALVAGRLRSHPCWDVRYLTEQLVSSTNRLAEMRADDRAVSTAFELSHRDLPADVARLFRLLSCHPGPDFDLYAAAAVGGGDLDTTRRLVERLYLDHLVEETAPGRYRLHDLVRHYAATLLAAKRDEDPVERVLDYYVHVATEAARLLPHPDAPADPVGHPPAHVPPLTTEAQATAWFTRERGNLTGCVDLAGPRHRVRLAAVLHPYLTQRGHWDDALAIHNVAVLAAERSGDVAGLAASLRDLGAVQLLADDYSSAMVNVSRAQRLYIQLGDARGEAAAIEHIGAVQYALGEYAAAARNLMRALALSGEVGDRYREASSHLRLGIVRHLTESYSRSSLSLVRAYTLYRELDCGQGQAEALSYLGLLQGMAGDGSPALRCLTKAVALFAEIGDRRGEATALCRMGTLLRAIGEHTEALATLHRAHLLFMDLDSYQGEANTLRGIAMTRYLASDRTAADYTVAVDALERALTLAGKIGDRLCEAGVYHDLGVLAHLAGHCQEATASLVRALNLRTEIGDPTGTVDSLNDLGRLAADWPEAGDAFSYHERALRMARDIGAFVAQARALEGMGRCLISDSYSGSGRAYLREALDLYERLGLPEAQGVQAALEALGRQ
ncbi:ATP-binding protein [Actinophytocola oryzae]|uniref:ATP-binding protein n=1 Tax=Actinophytocola oryzae TaxID=502181 RepID=UPI001414D3FF|nr:TIR domain-containing protein [Actinophytocola oryzae]